jgi:hypothetical protein
LFNPQTKTVGSVFKYWVGFPKPDDPNFSAWLFLFYDQVLFLCRRAARGWDGYGTEMEDREEC